MSTALTRARATTVPGLLGRNVFDNFFDNFFDDMPAYVKQSTQGYPVADIYTNDDGKTVMEFALAGFSRSELSVEVKQESRSITVSANSDSSTEAGRRIARRSFSKTFVNYNDDLDLSSAEAHFENGLLSIVVPRRPETQPLQIKIN